MTINLAKLIPVCPELERIAPNNIKQADLLKVIDQLSDLLQTIFPVKRCGYHYETLIYVELYAQLTGLSTKEASQDLQTLWKGHEQVFQSYQRLEFRNGKHRRAIPDQPTLSRFSKFLANHQLCEQFANLLVWAQFLYCLRTHLCQNRDQPVNIQFQRFDS